MTVLLPTSLPAHYPCQTRPGPTWHSLVDLIELDIPACLGIVCWHENFPAIPVKTVDKRGICNTCRQIWELEFLRDGGVSGKGRITSLSWCPSLVPSAEWALSWVVASFHPVMWLMFAFNKLNACWRIFWDSFPSIDCKMHPAEKRTCWWSKKTEIMHLKVSSGDSGPNCLSSSRFRAD